MSNGEVATNWKVHQLVLYCFFGILAGVVGGLLGLGGGFILGPLFLELGIPPQVPSLSCYNTNSSEQPNKYFRIKSRLALKTAPS